MDIHIMEWYYILGIVSYAIFILQAVCSIAGSELNFDLDFDGDVDFDGGDIFSFKGLLHFCIGMSTWLMATDASGLHTSLSPYIFYGIGIVCGIILMLILYFTYKFCLTFNHIPDKINLVGKQAKIYLYLGIGDNDKVDKKYKFQYTISVENANGYEEYTALSDTMYEKNQLVTIKEHLGNNIFLI